MSYAQLFQDSYCLQHFENKHGGYFVDIGANDGKTFSNTYLLESGFYWGGICVEPLPKEFELCKKLRKNSICKNVAIYDSEGTVDFTQIEGDYNMYSGISKDINHHKEITQQYGKVVSVPTITLQKLLDECEAPKYIDFLSLDTEGSELKILQSVDHTKYKFRYITLEHNFKEPIRTEIRKFLREKGYAYVGENQWDDMYTYDC